MIALYCFNQNCPNCLAINPFKKVHRDGAEIEICEFCNTIKEEEYEEYSKKRVQNKEDLSPVTIALIFAFAFVMSVLIFFYFLARHVVIL